MQLEFSLMLQSFNLAEQNIHNLRDYSWLATIFEACAHGICFTRTRLQQIENVNRKERGTENHVSVAWAIKLYLTISKNCSIISLEQTINEWSNTFFKHGRWGRTRASIDMIKGKGMCTNLYLHHTNNKFNVTVETEVYRGKQILN